MPTLVEALVAAKTAGQKAAATRRLNEFIAKREMAGKTRIECVRLSKLMSPDNRCDKL